MPHATFTTVKEAFVLEPLIARFADRPKYQFIDRTVDEVFDNAHNCHAPTNAESGVMEIVKHLYSYKAS